MSNSQMEVMMVQINKRGKDERQKKTIKIEFLLECNEWDKIEIHGLP